MKIRKRRPRRVTVVARGCIFRLTPETARRAEARERELLRAEWATNTLLVE